MSVEEFEWSSTDESTRQRRLDLYQQDIAQCRLCVDAGHIKSALPIFHGHASARVMVVGQAPAAPVSERPLPYSGATGRTLKDWLERAGFDPAKFYSSFYLTALTKCFPGTNPGGDGDRAPSRHEISLCVPHLKREIESGSSGAHSAIGSPVYHVLCWQGAAQRSGRKRLSSRRRLCSATAASIGRESLAEPAHAS